MKQTIFVLIAAFAIIGAVLSGVFVGLKKPPSTTTIPPHTPPVATSNHIPSPPPPEPAPPPIPPPNPIPPPSLWDSVADLSITSAFFQSITANGPTVHAAYSSHGVNYRRSLDQGISWEPWTNLGSGTLYLEDPIASDGSTVGIVTVDATETITDFAGPRQVGNLSIRLSRDNGATWEPSRQLTTAAKALRLSLAISGSTIHLAWMDYRTGKWDIRYIRSTDGGLTWESEQVLAVGTNAAGAQRPTLEANGNVIHVAWMDARDNQQACTIEGGTRLPFCTEIYYTRSSDGGVTWEKARRLTNDTPYSGRPDMAVKDSTIVILYDQRILGGQNDLGLLHSNDGGATWTQSLFVTAPDEQTHGKPVSNATGFHAVWMDKRKGGYRVYYSSSPDGLTWSSEESVPSSSNASAPAIGLTTDFVHVSWAGPNMKFIRREL